MPIYGKEMIDAVQLGAAERMIDVARIDPMLARHGLRAPAELDGFAVTRCERVSYHGEQPGLSNGHWVDAEFVVEGLDRPLTATTKDGGRTWTTVVSNR